MNRRSATFRGIEVRVNMQHNTQPGKRFQAPPETLCPCKLVFVCQNMRPAASYWMVVWQAKDQLSLESAEPPDVIETRALGTSMPDRS
jgi:hypothetical protein